jgi:hypothetical protein
MSARLWLASKLHGWGDRLARKGAPPPRAEHYELDGLIARRLAEVAPQPIASLPRPQILVPPEEWFPALSAFHDLTTPPKGRA